MKSIAIVGLFLLAGCTQKPQPKVVQGPVVTTTTHSAEVPESQLTDKQKIALLRKEAKARGLRWYVHCLPTDDGEDYFLAVAWPKDAANTDVIEDGGKGMWIYFEKVTQADAAYGLYQSIQQPMTHPPEHRKLEKPVWHKHCPPGLHGD